MRRLKVRYSLSSNGLPLLVLAALAPSGEACSTGTGDVQQHPPDGMAGGGAGGGAGRDASVGTGATGGTGGIVIPPTGGTGGGGATCFDAGTTPDPRYEWANMATPRRCCEFFIDLPPEGTPAMIDTICVDSGGPVESGWAARVVLLDDVNGTVQGEIRFGRAFMNRIAGPPTIAVVDAPDADWKNFVVNDMQLMPDGYYLFRATWPDAPTASDGLRITLEVTFAVQCEGEAGFEAGATRTVQALTNILMCTTRGSLSRWVSSGDICHVCAIIAEMAPTPIVPGAHEDPLPLGEALRLSVKTVARVGRSFILLAEHDGGSESFRYAWRASAGELVAVAEDVVVWTPPDEGTLEMVQVAVDSARAVAVASMRWDRAA